MLGTMVQMSLGLLGHSLVFALLASHSRMVGVFRQIGNVLGVGRVWSVFGPCLVRILRGGKSMRHQES